MDNRHPLIEHGFRVAILCGGDGSERDVSLVSGRAVHEAVKELEIPCDYFELEANALPDGLDPASHLVIPLIHGTYGEDGRLCADLEAAGFSYGGCDEASSALCFDKMACKAMATRAGLEVAGDVLLNPGEPVGYPDLADQLGGKMILKPRRDGSSVGLHVVASAGDFERAAGDLLTTPYLAESFNEGIDLTVGILGDKPLGVVGVFPEGGLYDYQHKYTPGMTRYEVPARIPETVRRQLVADSLSVYRLCQCRDLARVDFLFRHDGRPVFLEINTIPGMTPTSLLPKAAACEGITFSELIDRWIGFVLKRRLEGGTL